VFNIVFGVMKSRRLRCAGRSVAWTSGEIQTKFLSNRLEMKKLVSTLALLVILDTIKIVIAKLAEE